MSATSGLDLEKIEAALNAYDWTNEGTRAPYGRRDRYDTIGLLLRYADVPPEEIERVGCLAWHRRGITLVREYGLRDEVDCYLIEWAGSFADSHADATDRVLRALAGDMSAVGDWDWLTQLVENRVLSYRPPGGR